MSGDARDFNNIETRTVINFFFLQGKAPKEIHAILTETLGEHVPSYVSFVVGLRTYQHPLVRYQKIVQMKYYVLLILD